MTRGRGNELQREIDTLRRELGERIAAAEARAAAAERLADAMVKALVQAGSNGKRREGATA